jgi:hypothetical protein
MWSFFFKTVPIDSPATEWMVWIALAALFVVVAGVIVPLSANLDPLLRAVFGYGVSEIMTFGLSTIRRERARTLGVPFISRREAGERLFRWLTNRPLILSVGQMFPIFALVSVAVVTLLRGHQIWRFDHLDWFVILASLTTGVVVSLVGFVWRRKNT